MQYRNGSTWRRGVMLGCCAMVAACAAGHGGRTGPVISGPVAPGSSYVAMGSSFAAGPGVVAISAGSPVRCQRSTNNYAHVLARRLDVRLTDASCSGATTDHLLGPWNDLPPQIDSLTAETRLVTITIGGNDVGYIGALGAASCRSFSSPPPGTPGGTCPDAPSVTEANWTKLDASLRRIVSEVRRRSPDSRIVFVDYVTILPPAGACAAAPLTAAQADAGRETARRLAALTARVAAEAGAEVFRASDLSRDHGACSPNPWVSGFPLPGGPGFVPYHPNARGMTAVGEALARHLRRPATS